MKQYHDHLIKILTDDFSQYKPNRTGIDTISRFGYQNEYDLSKGFPLLTTKKVYARAIIHELLWFMRGDTNLKYLVDNNVRIWNEWGFERYLKSINKELKMYSDEWKNELDNYINKIKEDSEFAKKHGELGPVYGKQWRKWEVDGEVIDQFKNAVETLKKSPNSRRIIVTAWNPAEVKNMALPPCHSFYQLNVTGDALDLQLYQRSADMFLGVPFNIASYALLVFVLAKQAGLKPGRFIHTFGDSHIYCGAGERGAFYGKNKELLKQKILSVKKREDYLEIKEWIEKTAPDEPKGKEGQDHITAVLEQLSREPKPIPKIKIKDKPLEELQFEDFEIIDYDPHPAIKRNVAV
ncbi:MAG: thymidylate synthase [Candidatus Woesearchaeota archaeon]